MGATRGEPLGVTGEGSRCPRIEGQLLLSPRERMTGAEVAGSPARYDGPLIRTSYSENFNKVIFGRLSSFRCCVCLLLILYIVIFC